MTADLLTLDDDPQEGMALLQPCLLGGKRVAPSPMLSEVRHVAATQLACLPEHLRQLRVEPPYPVVIAPALRQLALEVDRHTV
jgi:nicotinate phosphoribosyltransferase